MERTLVIDGVVGHDGPVIQGSVGRSVELCVWYPSIDGGDDDDVDVCVCVCGAGRIAVCCCFVFLRGTRERGPLDGGHTGASGGLLRVPDIVLDQLGRMSWKGPGMEKLAPD